MERFFLKIFNVPNIIKKQTRFTFLSFTFWSSNLFLLTSTILKLYLLYWKKINCQTIEYEDNKGRQK